MAVKEGLREAETQPAGDGAARENEVTGMQKCQGKEHCCVYARIRTHTRTRMLIWLLAFTQ